MSIGLWILVGTVAVAAVVGGLIAWRDGRFRPVRPGGMTGPAPADSQPDRGVEVEPAEVGAEGFGERATLVHFSSAFCAPCRATRQVLTQVSAAVPGVDHVEVDAESHLDLVRRLAVRRTPTVLVLDPDGRIRARASGLPRKADVLAAVGSLVPRDDVP